MKTPAYRKIALIIVITVCSFTQASHAQSVSSETQAVEQLAELLVGEFDSFRQWRADISNNVEKSQAHGWVNRAFIRVHAPEVADIVVVGSTVYNGPLGIVDKNEFLVWTFKRHADGNHITMSPRRFKNLDTKLVFSRDADKLAGFSDLDLEDAISGAACDIVWKPSASGFTGQSESCRVMSTTQNKMLDWNWHYDLDQDGISIAFNGVDDAGKVLDGTPEDNPYRLNRLATDSYYRQGKELLFNAQKRAEYATSRALLERAVQSDPQHAAAIVALIYSYVKTNLYAEAQTYLKSAKALANTLNPTEALWLAGLEARISDDYDQEIAAWTKLTQIAPKQKWAWYELASVYYRSQLYQQSVTAIEGALFAEPDEKKWSASYIYYLHSKSLYRIGKLRESIAASEPGVRNKNTQRATFYRKIIAQIANGDVEDPSESLARYREMSAKDGKVDEAILQTNIALLFFELGDYSNAIKHAQMGYKLSQKPYHAWALAYARTENGEIKQALDILNSAKNEYPKAVNILAGLGWAYYRSGQYERALNYLQAAQQETLRKNSGVERDLKIIQAAINTPDAEQVPPMRWFGD